jgi:hypothetical protein
MGKQKKETPKTYQVRLSSYTLQNIDEITGYIAFINHQPLNAIKIGDAIFKTINKIASNPFLLRNVKRSRPKQKCIVKLNVPPGLLYIK